MSSVLEIQAAYIARIVGAMRDHGVRKLSVKPAAAAAYERWLDARLRLMVWYEVANFWRKGGTAPRRCGGGRGCGGFSSSSQWCWQRTGPAGRAAARRSRPWVQLRL